MQRTNTLAAARTETKLLRSLPKLPTDGSRAYVLYRLGKTWAGNGQLTKAETLWQQILTEYRDSWMAGFAQVQLARLYESQGNLTGAVSMYEAFLRNPDAPQRFKLHAHAHLFRLKRALGDMASARAYVDQARQIALQSNDAELLFDLANYYERYGDEDVARQFLERGLLAVEDAIRAEKNPAKKLWWVYLVTRRLEEFGETGRLIGWLTRFERDLLANKALDDGKRFASYYIWARALENAGRTQEAEAVADKTLQAVPEDSEWVGILLYRMRQQAKQRGDAVGMRQLAEAAFREKPTGRLVQRMYFESAVDDFNAGRVAETLRKVNELEKAIPAVEGLTSAQRLQGECWYLKGRCLISTGKLKEGQDLIQEALRRNPDAALIGVLSK